MIRIDKEFEDLIPPLLSEETEKLEASIKKEGIREPLIVWNGVLIDGHNRLRIARKLGIEYKTKEMKFYDKNEALIWMINNQLGRRNISRYDRTKLALRYEEIIAPKAKENLKLSDGRGQKGKQISANLNTRNEVAKIAKVSHDTVSKVKLIEKFASNEQKERLSRQEDSINHIYHEVKKRIIEKNGNKQIKMPEKKFGVIYADPPWRYQFSQTTERAIETNYNTMSLEEIKALKIPSDKDCVLFLWATAPKLKEALEVMEAWGFEYKTHAIWDKEIMGMGYWFRGQHELLLVGTKGNVKTPKESDRVPSVFRIKRSEHSKKPEQFVEFIEKSFPNSTYIELFARKNREGWQAWGNEI